MKHFTAAKLIGLVGLVVVATAAGTASAAATQATPPQTGQQQQAPSTCASTTGSSDTTSPIITGDPYGPAALVADALSKVCLSDDQRGAIEQLGREVKPKEEAVANARHAFVTTLAEEVRSDNFDDSALRPKIDDLVKTHEDASPVMRKALEDLHGILDSGQRAAFVDAIEARMKDIGDASKSWLDSLSKDLGISDDQKAHIKDILDRSRSDVDSDRDRAKSIFDAFKGDQFSIDQVAPEKDVGARVRSRADAMVDCARDIAGILTADQRNKLADMIESKIGGNATGAEPSGKTPSTGTPSTGTPATGTPSTGTPSTGTPSTGTPNTQPSTGEPSQQAPSDENVDTSQEALFIGRGGGYRVGAVRGWGGGYGYAGGWGYRGVRTAYFGGYPFIGGYAPGIW